MATNIGHLYYKHYFNKLELHKETGKPKLKDPINQQLFDLRLTDYLNLVKTPYKEPPVSLTTIYPGLLIGSGYLHEVGGKEIESELKLGFYFDHTTGLPVIPGSSVKGLLRSAFKKVNGEYIKELFDDLGIDYKKNILELEKAVFDNNASISIYNRDIFFDAYPLKSGNENAAFLANDYITHHEDPLKNPNPVQFMKILPNVQFRFNFKLTGNGGLPAEDKLKLFKQILLDLGIGAKTNVGYGQFVESSDNSTPSPNPYEELLAKYTANWSNYSKGKEIETKILIEDKGYFIFKRNDDYFVKSIANIKKKFENDAVRKIKKGKSGKYETLKVGDEVFIRINNIEDKNFTVMPKWTAGGSSL